MSTYSRLSEAYRNAKVIPYNINSKFVVMSDCHRGAGNWGDNFQPNQNIFFYALKYYYKHRFTYIEIGDGDELWENRSIRQIIQVHSDAFWIMSKFYEDNRFYMLFGNHDRQKQSKKFIECNCNRYYCDSTNEMCPLFPGLEIYEGILLKDYDTNYNVFLTHGHQGQFLNDIAWRLGRFLVRYLWRRLELMGIHDPTSTAKNYHTQNKVEKKLIEWAKKQKKMLLTGHTHRPSFPKVGDTMYFNDGSCVHPRCITAIEIANGTNSLVKWSVQVREDGTMFVGRTVLEPPVRIRDYYSSLYEDEFVAK